jgi:hypothetical protein
VFKEFLQGPGIQDSEIWDSIFDLKLGVGINQRSIKPWCHEYTLYLVQARKQHLFIATYLSETGILYCQAKDHEGNKRT